MAEFPDISAEGETPVNPYSLLEAVNRSSDTAHTAWLIFLGLMTYLMVAVAGVTHEDFLVQKPVSLPILQVDIPQTQFFQFAPVILVLLHLGVVAQLVLVARKTLEFDKSIRLLETSHHRTHPLRLELHNFFFVQGIAGPQRSAVMSTFLHAMSWLTLVILPVVLILYIQVVFLPYHDVAITWTHRIALIVDVAMLVLIGVFLSRAETSFFKAFWRTVASHPIGVFFTAAVLSVVTIFSLFVATIPDETMDKIARSLMGRDSNATQSVRDRRYRSGFLLPFWSSEDNANGPLFGMFHRNLVVTDTDLVVDKDVSKGEPSLNLRGRDLRYAMLDRSDLHQADLTGAKLNNASFDGTDLRDAWMHCADLNELLLTEDRERAVCTTATHADFSRANLAGARMTGIDARHASFEAANLNEAQLTYAILIGTGFSSASLQKTDLTGGVQAHGANFLVANVQGADFTGAQLQYADFSSASMQAAMFNYTHLQGGILRGANLDAASFLRSKLQGADLSDATIIGTDLRWASVWESKAPNGDPKGLADLSSLNFEPIADGDRETLQKSVDGIKAVRLRRQVGDAIKPLMSPNADAGGWADSQGGLKWRDVAEDAFNGRNVTPQYRNQLTNYLSDIMCRVSARDGAVATGIVRRAKSPLFRGNVRQVYTALSSQNCAALKAMPESLMTEFSATADQAKPIELAQPPSSPPEPTVANPSATP
ncbi:MAG: pentapeptide repeat-containing protein [Hyphomicrobiaceae bacterium]